MAAMVFKELAAGVKACYRNVDRVFQTSDSAATREVVHCALLDGDTNTRGRERKFFDKRTMPFGMHATGSAWWETWHKFRGQRSQDVLHDELIESYGLEMNDFKTNTSAIAYCQQISQRYVEDNRIVFVWDAYIEPYGFKNERVHDVYFLEQMYVLIEPDKEDSEKQTGDDEGVSTQISLCYVIKPRFMDPKLKDDAKTDAMVNFLTSAVLSKIMNLRERMETLLLDQALQQQ
ncbi:unnamed protein product [Phytophthora fragariaefolia]|uniref:Unnamed protein product n=1 Tax=Phytophthora fragariaefolia TaxID=1490495 RepID=A0A9W7D1R8_9STRA|nr:unnamed protein product [Phytophthora fragariaefolia]